MEQQKDLFTIRQAAEYLGMNFYTFRRKVIVTHEFDPDVKFVRAFYFKKETLDSIIRDRNEYLSVAEAAEYLNIPITRLDYYQYYAVAENRLIPDQSVGSQNSRKENRFKKSTLDDFRQRVLNNPGAITPSPVAEEAATEPKRVRRGPRLGPRRPRARVVVA
jgi:hypothetical protein